MMFRLQTSLFLLSLLHCIMEAHASLPIRVLTHNIRYAADPPSTGERSWSVRKQLIANELKYNTLHNPEAFICLQEVLHSQLLDIMSGLGAEWAYLGVGRDDGQQSGEYSPIIYRKAIWQVSTWRTVWLNEKQECCKKGWDAGSVRIITVGTFQHSESKRQVVGLCTHLDNAGAVARRESAKIILKTIDFVTDPTNNTSATGIESKEALPFFLAGDFNSEPTGEAHQMLNGKDSKATDVKELASWKYGHQNSWTDFDDKDLTLLDFVFVGPRGGDDWDVEGYSVLANRFDDGVYNSDHRAVVADTLLKV
jgi:endonuclease/exonuclease/phosphatase family metal-dependent hydrolase